MTVVNLVIALVLVAASWWAVARLLAWSLTRAEPGNGSAAKAGERRLPDNRVLRSRKVWRADAPTSSRLRP